MSQRHVLVPLAALVCAGGLVAQGADVLPHAQRPVKAGDWEYALTPYLWFPMTANADFKTEAGAGGGGTPALDIADDSGFFENIGIAPNARFEMRGQGLVFHFDGKYFNQDTDARLSTNAPATLDFEGLTGEIGIGLEAATWRTEDGGMGHWDVFVGARATSLDTEIRAGATSLDVDSEWLDLVVGTRVSCEFAKDWSIGAGISVGGFGLAESAELSLDAYLGVSYAVAENIELELGWRFLVLDRDENGVDFNLTLHGPTLGAVLRF
jgi:opacity protein-like surface antigen